MATQLSIVPVPEEVISVGVLPESKSKEVAGSLTLDIHLHRQLVASVKQSLGEAGILAISIQKESGASPPIDCRKSGVADHFQIVAMPRGILARLSGIFKIIGSHGTASIGIRNYGTGIVVSVENGLLFGAGQPYHRTVPKTLIEARVHPGEFPAGSQTSQLVDLVSLVAGVISHCQP